MSQRGVLIQTNADDKPNRLTASLKQIEEVQQELCLIKLCWPEVDRARDLYLKSLPSGYCTVTDKEKLLAWYAENFRRQYHAKYPERKPLLLMCENECGVQKFVSTTIRRSTLPYPELYTWQGCGEFVSDYIEYEPLDKALKMCQVVHDSACEIPSHLSHWQRLCYQDFAKKDQDLQKDPGRRSRGNLSVL
ncbi:Coiled-coil domain-containing protein lobo like protein [Melipona quadrifasciata]|uniref:Coiled-coil domain-containing protein lobo like protein n=1 Tax=Melipona quadrifasciata TaxID=166423 RepID=A0A0N0BDF3_9HYME|nr:Coiled-coil domain-containing protein lobo like protein [Melipona quadrifasciata]